MHFSMWHGNVWPDELLKHAKTTSEQNREKNLTHVAFQIHADGLMIALTRLSCSHGEKVCTRVQTTVVKKNYSAAVTEVPTNYNPNARSSFHPELTIYY